MFNSVSLAWVFQKKQLIEWIHGDAFKGAVAALRTLFIVHELNLVQKNSKQHLKSNLLALFAMTVLFGLLYIAINICCHIIGLVGWDVVPPSLFYAYTWAIWTQVGLWSIILRYFFDRSSEDCFYERMKTIENDRISIVQTWPENYSILMETWGSIKRTFRYFVLELESYMHPKIS